MLRDNTSLRVLVVLVLVLSLGVMAGCDSTPDTQPPSEPEPAIVEPEPAEPADADGKPTIAEAEAAVLALAREEYSTIPLVSATAYAIGRDAQGTWWVQAWTQAGPEFEGEPNEQWFVTYDGETWTLMNYGTGLGIEDFPQVTEWEQLQ